MAGARFSAALRRIREVVELSAGRVRVTPIGRFGGDAPDGMDDAGLLSRAASMPRVETRIASVEPSPASPPVGGNLRIYDVTFEVRITRLVTPLEQVSDECRDALMAAAAEDADMIAQALTYPGNLSATSDGEQTGVMSGCLLMQDARTATRGLIRDGAQPIETTLTMLGRLIARTSVAP